MRAAAEHNCFLMEGVWTRFFPAVKHARAAIGRGEIGEVVGATVQFGFNDAVRIADRVHAAPQH